MSNFTKTLCGVLLITGSLFANEAEQTEKKHINVGEREMSYAERISHKETRAQVIEENKNIEETEEPAENAKMIKAFNATTYYTTHNGAFHHPYSVAWDGSSVELADGSIWTVSSDDRWSTLNWLTGDVIIIVPHHNLFSIYNYKLININTGAHVKVNLSLGPIYNGIYTHWIVGIDQLFGEIQLEDGSLWKMSSWDSSVTNKWFLNDTVIIGINDGWLSTSNPNILINVNTNNHAIGYCVY
jgi:hypothetical protein